MVSYIEYGQLYSIWSVKLSVHLNYIRTNYTNNSYTRTSYTRTSYIRIS